MDHCWLMTWTCYGHWLPGDARGFVGNVRDKTGGQVVHNIPGTPYDADMPRLEQWVRTQMKGRPVTLGRPEAEAMIAQYQETARIRQWAVQAAVIYVVKKQPNPLVTWFAPPWQDVLDEWERARGE